MPFDKPIVQTSNPFKQYGGQISNTRSIFYGEVMSIDDKTDGGVILVKIPDLDLKVDNENLPKCYPLLPKFFHLYPKVGEIVRVFIEDVKYPNKSRFWLGSIISQLQKVEYDNIYSALSTTNIQIMKPEPALSTLPDADGVFPKKEDVAIIGRVNTDLILKPNQTLLRAGKHENGSVYKLNIKNPAQLILTYEPKSGSTTVFQSSSVVQGDKIALISHDGKPQFKASNLSTDDRNRIFDEGHPMVRGDVLVKALELMRKTIINHIHGYSGLNADKSAVINDLEKIDFDAIMQKNIVIN